MELRILGSVDLLDANGTERPLAPQARTLLASLLVRANRSVAADSLIEALWADDAPATATKIVQQRISEIRRAMGDESTMLETRPGGYCLLVDSHDLDAARFENLVGEARRAAADGRSDEAVVRFDEALECWGGTPFDGVATTDEMTAEAARLEELRLVATEEQIECRLADGHHREVVPRLKNLIDSHPLRERFTAQLMLALYRSGRQTAALRAFEDLRKALAENVGIDPAPAVRDLEAAILAQDESLDLPATNASRLSPVPIPLSSFVGRETLLAELGEALARHRLVTLTGVGGSGKTRLAIEFARLSPDPTCFVDLAAITDPDLVWRVLADSLSLPTQPGEPLDATVIASLASRDLLIVLDNCEHVLDACGAIVHELLTHADRTRIIATSRESFAIPGEFVRVVPPLDLPETDADQPEAAESVRLFVDRATEAGAGFALTDENRTAVIELCRHLDGIPLALELAASSVVAMEPGQIVDRLFEGLGLVGEPGPRPERQQTLGATIAWSHERLSDSERDLFDQLSVFPGSFDLEAVEEVCGTEGVDGVPAALLMGRLVRKSMVMREQPEAGLARYRLLDTLRNHGATQLRDRGADRAVEEALFRRALRLAEDFASAGHIDGAAQERASAAIKSSYHQCRTALAWAIPREPQDAARMIAALSLYWVRVDMFAEGLRYIDQILAHRDVLDTETIAAILASGAALYAEEGDSPAALELGRESLAIYEDLGAEHGVARARLAVGRALSNTGDYEEAIDHLEWAHDWFAATGHSLRLTTLRSLAFVAMFMGEYERAEQLLQETLSEAVDQQRPYNEAKAFWMLGAVERDRGRLTQAFDYCERALEIFIRLDDRSAIAHARSTLGDIAKLDGDIERAIDLYDLAYRDLLEIGDRRCSASSLKNKADIVRAFDPRAAAQHYAAALDQRHSIGDRPGVAECLEGLASTARRMDQALAATMMLAQASTLRETTGAPVVESDRDSVERETTLVREQLDTTRFEAAWEEGRNMTLEAAVELAHDSLR